VTDTVAARVAALKTTSVVELKKMWRELFHNEPPPFNRRFIETRLAYRIQELVHGGLKRDTLKRIELLGEQLDGGKKEVRRRRQDNRPIAGTRLIRDWQGNPCEVLVGVDYFDYQGRRYKSLSSIAKAITGTNRNGWAFFGLVSARSAG
jgi:hypothetical protein